MGFDKTCEACGSPISFIKGPKGKLIPVQRVRTVYALSEGQHLRALQPQVSELYVSHFETCSDPNRFSRGRR